MPSWPNSPEFRFYLLSNVWRLRLQKTEIDPIPKTPDWGRQSEMWRAIRDRLSGVNHHFINESSRMR
jgi:hypothetical protein